MSQAIRAIYHDGQLQLLDSVDLAEGQEIQVLILHDTDKVQAALGDLLVKMDNADLDNFDELALLKEIELGFRDTLPLSQTIIEERQSLINFS